MNIDINISQYNYELPSERIAKFPLENREDSKLLIFRDGSITDDSFLNIRKYLQKDCLLAFNNTRVIRARLIFVKPTGARIEIFCLEPISLADYERAFAVTGSSHWSCIVGNAKKWKTGKVYIKHQGIELSAQKTEVEGEIRFEWNSDHTFGELLELLGNIPIPPYLERESQQIDNTRYQTTYSRIEGSVAAPTAGLHFTDSILNLIPHKAEVTLHVGAGTFLPVKCDNIADHAMHTEHFSINIDELKKLADFEGEIIAVGTTTVRTLESLAVLGERILETGSPDNDRTIGQWEAYKEQKWEEPLNALYNYMISHKIITLNCSTQIMITPGYRFRTISGLVTNFHQPKSTLLLLISAIIGDSWRSVYAHALENGYRFLSYGDSSLLMLKNYR